MYEEDEYLPLSGVQHYAYCPRQWGLICVEQTWTDNINTANGQAVHERCHDVSLHERRGDKLVVRGLRVSSSTLGLSGICDVVEFCLSTSGVCLNGVDGLWCPIPVEYKSGTTKQGSEDRIQVCAQAICLEEMFLCQIEKGYLYYDRKKRRDEVLLTTDLRLETQRVANKMHELFSRGLTPKVKKRKGCAACSLKNHCLPELEGRRSVAQYISDALMSD